ncbi:hypothetical protein CANARDRAFT_10027 [[Candida] arabinofermentans NRRL YB-2248]|uniref:Acetylornithine aminotransferase, mitochondrial n=1 Tax=[Candida] arabinofermentans NRRL YB-2248 TaxID=983967 RepID=A0A1E4STV3_9ASCO|nr:hypothetical protein CANARDRAFT_10027 [[Candida] arabinofermentans NRRL YB-2248]
MVETKVEGLSPFMMHRSLIESPHLVESANGSYLKLTNGKKILDACGGAAVVSIGHCNERVIKALTKQLETVHYVHTLDYSTQPAEALATMIIEPYKEHLAKAYFANSGSEANEAAFKLALQYFHDKGLTTKTQFISRNQSYHGNCLGGLSASGHVSRKRPFTKYVSPNFHFVSPANEYRYKPEYTSVEEYVALLGDELENKILELGPENVAAFIAETVVGASTGGLPAPKGYFKLIRKICDKYNVLLILDEIMCGSGRTGTFFAWEQEGIIPDITTCGKAIASGYSPLSACICTHKVVDGLLEGSCAFNNGHTYQSHPLSCRAGLEVLGIIKEENLLENVTEMGKYLGSMLNKRLRNFKCVGDIRGRGLFWGIEFVQDQTTKKPFDSSLHVGALIQRYIWESNVAVYPGGGTANGVEGDHVLIAPMYIVTKEEIDIIVSTVEQCIKRFEDEQS